MLGTELEVQVDVIGSEGIGYRIADTPGSKPEFDTAWIVAPPLVPGDADVVDGVFIEYDVLYSEDLLYAPPGVDLFEEASEGEFYITPVSEAPFWAIRNEEGEGYRGLTFPEFQQAKEIDVFVNS